MADAQQIRWCIENGELAELKSQLSKSDKHVDDVSLTAKRPAIICAADYGQTEVVKFLIDRGSNVNVLDEYGISALLAAIWEEHASTVELLLANGADKSMKSPAGKSYREEAPNDKIRALIDKH